MRHCPVCEDKERTKVFTMYYDIPDAWPLPDAITWFTCNKCGMIYGDGDFDQVLFNDYYANFYGYGVNGVDSERQLNKDAAWIAQNFDKTARILDYGGGGDDGTSRLCDLLAGYGMIDAQSMGVNDTVPADCDVVYASHVLEHVYDLPDVMYKIEHALKVDGLLIVDVPESMGLLLHWRKPILDFNTKHLNHFTVRTMVCMAYRYGFELVDHNTYIRDGGRCVQFHFKHIKLAEASTLHIMQSTVETLAVLAAIDEPVNVWGLNDRAWYVLGKANLKVLDYIDNDPAYRGRTYAGKEVQERPRNDAPIVIIAQGQGGRLVANIKAAGWQNRIIEV
jgi:hypothetical protein